MAMIVCAQCRRLTPRTGQRQSYCPDCRKARKRARDTEHERLRRQRSGGAIRARDRERYATDPRIKAQKISSALARDVHVRSDPATRQIRRGQVAAAHARYVDRTLYDGNRKRARERDDNTCQMCGVKRSGLHVHHIDGRGSALPVEQQNNELSNLITLCASCHGRVHRLREAEQRLVGMPEPEVHSR